MRLNTALGVLGFFALETSLSSSPEVSEYRWVKSDNGDLLCGTSPPNKTLNAVKSRALCVWSCGEGCQLNSCETVNYWTNAKRCELFDYLPCSYDVQQDCANFQVTANKFWITIHASYNNPNSFLCFRLIITIRFLTYRSVNDMFILERISPTEVDLTTCTSEKPWMSSDKHGCRMEDWIRYPALNHAQHTRCYSSIR